MANGIIDDGTELMSEYDIQGNKVFANGLVKLGHYFDKDGNGVVEAKEMKGLMFWIDDGDGKTEAGELQPLSKFGITEIRIPADDKTLKTEYKQAKKRPTHPIGRSVSRGSSRGSRLPNRSNCSTGSREHTGS